MYALFPALVSASLGLSFLPGLSPVARVSSMPSWQPDVTAPIVVDDKCPVIRVSATGEVQRRPDFAQVFLGVEERAQTAQQASERAGTKIAQIVKAVEATRLPGIQIQTSEVRLNPVYQWKAGDEPQRVHLGYDASSIIKVRVDDAKAIGRLIDAATAAGANRIDGISFEITQGLEARQEAIRLAARAARDKATTLAEALDLKITGIIEATVSSDEPRPWMMGIETANLTQASRADGGFDGSVEPGLVTIRAQASVTFSARPR